MVTVTSHRVSIDDIKTVAQCDAVLNEIITAIPVLERRLKAAVPTSSNQPPGWRTRAEQELREKRLDLPRAQQRRAELTKLARAEAHGAVLAEQQRVRLTRERLILDVIRQTEPDVHSRAVQIARTRHPDAFAAGGA